MKPRYWKPLQRAAFPPPSEKVITEIMRLSGESREKVVRDFAFEEQNTTVWKNDTYQVVVHELDSKVVHLCIRRTDGKAIIHDWRHLQEIKNQLLGEECEAIELYPAESRKVDTTNKYHLIGIKDPTYRFPFGDIFGNKRDVSYESGNTSGTRQRSL